MKRITLILLAVWLAVLPAPALAQTSPAPHIPIQRGGHTIEIETDMPTTATAVVNEDVWLDLLTISNNNATPITFTVTNNESTPKAFLTTVTLNGNSVYVMPLFGRKFTGGLRWSCSSAGVVAYMRGWVR